MRVRAITTEEVSDLLVGGLSLDPFRLHDFVAEDVFSFSRPIIGEETEAVEDAKLVVGCLPVKMIAVHL